MSPLDLCRHRIGADPRGLCPRSSATHSPRRHAGASARQTHAGVTQRPSLYAGIRAERYTAARSARAVLN